MGLLRTSPALRPLVYGLTHLPVEQMKRVRVPYGWPMKYIEGVISLVVIFSKWAWAKVRGKDYSTDENP